METPLGAFPDGEWDCIRRMLAIEEQEHSLPFLSQSSFMFGDQEVDDGSIGIHSMFHSAPEFGGRNESMFHSLDSDNSNLHYNSQESSHNSNCSDDHTVFIANPDDTNCTFGYPDNLLAYSTYASKGCCMSELDPGFFVPSLTDTVMKESVNFNNEDERSDGSENNSDHIQVEPIVLSPKQLQLKRKPRELDGINISSSGNQKKRPNAASKDVQRCMKSERSKKKQKLIDRNGNDAEETTNNAGSDNGHGSSNYTYTSEDDNNVNQENNSNSASLNSNGKPRASRGSATDPQSLYARKRRERINERLRILQNLVPNGTKVDISTMLEEALHYVKFLQLQIKLLSSDDLWMYAPIAYNGLDIGLDLTNKISRPS